MKREFQCPACGAMGASVVDSRPRENLRLRRYRCEACGKRFSTVEIGMEVYEKLVRAVKLYMKEKQPEEKEHE